jgi:LacI family transcriptional regulator
MVGPVKRVTIRDVADVAGLSPAAVSYALRGIMVSEETQDRVRRLADELGYEANPIARALASGRSGMIGILGPTLEDLWQQRLVVEAGRVLQERDRYALILDAGGSAATNTSKGSSSRRWTPPTRPGPRSRRLFPSL